MVLRQKYGRFIGRRVLISGMAAAAVLSGSFGATLGQGTDGSGRMSTAPVIAQQVVTFRLAR